MTAPHLLLDTNICIYIRRERPERVRVRLADQRVGSVAMSVITWGELLYGAHHSQHAAIARAKLARLAHLIPILPLPEDVAEHYGEIRAGLAAKGQMIGANDLWIAAHARSMGLVLVTNNAREFKRVKGLKVENWV